MKKMPIQCACYIIMNKQKTLYRIVYCAIHNKMAIREYERIIRARKRKSA